MLKNVCFHVFFWFHWSPIIPAFKKMLMCLDMMSRGGELWQLSGLDRRFYDDSGCMLHSGFGFIHV